MKAKLLAVLFAGMFILKLVGCSQPPAPPAPPPQNSGEDKDAPKGKARVPAPPK